MNLIIFDIDGTLTHTNEINSICFAQAISEHIGINDLNTNWHEYKYSTDSGLLWEIYQKYFNNSPTSEDIASIQNRFINLLNDKFQKNHPCIPIRGAREIIEKIHLEKNYGLAIATGGWFMTATLQLDLAKINHSEVPKAYSDEQHFERTDIILHAIEQSERYYEKNFIDITYIGDRNWDYIAAQKLGINFIGIGKELTQLGYEKTLNDLSNEEKFFKYLNSARK